MIDLVSKARTKKTGSDVVITASAAKITIHKPVKVEWFKTCPDPEYCVEFGLLEMKGVLEKSRRVSRSYVPTYIVMPEVRDDEVLEGLVVDKVLATCCNHKGEFFLWPVKVNAIWGDLDDWSQTALDAFYMSKNNWTRLAADTDAQQYKHWNCVNEAWLDPNWSSLPSYEEILMKAFSGHIIEDRNHPVLVELRGGNV